VLILAHYFIKEKRGIYLPHPLCPPLLGGEGEEKERGADAPLKLPHSIVLKEYNYTIWRNITEYECG